jgi:uncharacterized membrane protein YqgA involved in biofilm formation
MLGPVVNAAAIVFGALIGKFLIRGIPERFEEIVRKAIGLAVLYIGIKGTLENQHVMLLIFCMLIGSLIGEALDIDGAMKRLSALAEKKMGFSDPQFSAGFVNASILYCTGSMAIIGAMNSGLLGDHEMLFAKSILDGVMAIVFASTLSGAGVALSAIPVLLYEGGIALAAGIMKQVMTAQIITEMSAVGSLLIAAIGLNFLISRQIKVANMIPAIFLPWLFLSLQPLLQSLFRNLGSFGCLLGF